MNTGPTVMPSSDTPRPLRDESLLEAARRELECSARRAVEDYKASTGRVVESIDVTTEGIRARTRDPNDIDIAMGWA